MSFENIKECRPYWPIQSGTSILLEVSDTKIKVSMLELVETTGWKAYRLFMEVSLTKKLLAEIKYISICFFLLTSIGRHSHKHCLLQHHAKHGFSIPLRGRHNVPHCQLSLT